MELIFDERGNLQPYEKIKLTLDEFEAFFIDKFPNNNQRKQIFNNYLEFVNDFSTQVSSHFIQWINGSFVTTKEYPNDIDFVTIISHEIFESKE